MTTEQTSRHATHAEWNALAAKCSNRAAFLAGEVPCYEDLDGLKRLLPPDDLATRELPRVVVKASPPGAPAPARTAITAPPPVSAADELLREIELLGETEKRSDADVLADLIAPEPPRERRAATPPTGGEDIVAEAIKLGEV